MAQPIPAPSDPIGLDRFTRLAAREMEAPLVCLSVVDANRRLLMSTVGVSPPIALLVSWFFLGRMVSSGRALVVTDVRTDPRVARHPAVRESRVAAYLGMRLTGAPDRRVVGTLSIMDWKARHWTLPQLDFLGELCARIAREVEFAVPSRCVH